MSVLSQIAVGPGAAVALLLKAVAGGVFSVFVTWALILSAESWRLNTAVRKLGVTGPVAVAGGWTALMRSPIVAVVLSAAFGVGFFVVARFAGRR